MSWEEIGLSGGVKRAVLAESQCGDFFGTVSEASSCLSAGLLFPIAGITRIAAWQQDTWRTPREAGDHLAEGLCCGHSPGHQRVAVGGCREGAACHAAKVGHLPLGNLFCSHHGLQWHGTLESCHHGGAGIEEFSCWIWAMFLVVILDTAVSFKGNATVLPELLAKNSSFTQLKKKKKRLI